MAPRPPWESVPLLHLLPIPLLFMYSPLFNTLLCPWTKVKKGNCRNACVQINCKGIYQIRKNTRDRVLTSNTASHFRALFFPISSERLQGSAEGVWGLEFVEDAVGTGRPDGTDGIALGRRINLDANPFCHWSKFAKHWGTKWLLQIRALLVYFVWKCSALTKSTQANFKVSSTGNRNNATLLDRVTLPQFCTIHLDDIWTS